MFRKITKIPAFFHNFTGYDSHLLFKSLSTLKNPPEVLEKSLEKFTAMTIGNIEIKDSLNFMSCSLDKLVSNLKEKGKKENKTLQETFPNTYAYFKKSWNHVGEDAFEMLTRKGVYPYEYINPMERFKEKQLPEIQHFYSSLTGEDISVEDYQFGQELWRKFNLKNIGGYMIYTWKLMWCSWLMSLRYSEGAS